MGISRQALAGRLAVWRQRRRGPVAFVLSGGGPLGAIQVGQLGALFTLGITPDLILGSSVGAFNGIFVAGDPTLAGASRLRELWTTLRRDDFFPRGRLTSAWNAVRKGSHLYSNAGLRRLVEREFPEATFEGLVVPTSVVATNLETGQERWFSSGPIIEPLLASTAMPGVFPPVVIDGEPYIDGGIANNVPFSKAVELGAKKVFVLNVHSVFHQRPLNRPHDFMMHGYLLARAQRYRHEKERLSREAEIIEFPPVEVGYVPFTSLSHTERLIDAGFDSVLEVLKGGGPVEPGGEPTSLSG
jgi:NTE family protein